MIETGAIRYGRVVSSALPYAETISRVKEALREQGFGVLYELDIAKTLREKIGDAFRPYTILGACNPQLAQRALHEEAQMGLLLPCNVVVQEVEGRAIVSAIDAHDMLNLTGNLALTSVADEVSARINRTLDNIAREA